MEPQKKREIFICVQNLYKRWKIKHVYLLSFFSLGMLELLPLLADLELSLAGEGSGNLSWITLAAGREAGFKSSSDLEQERSFYKFNAKCTSKRLFYW